MNTGFRQESAKIYEFPLRARATARSHPDGSKVVAELRTQPMPGVECGSGWYHDAAMLDVDRTRKP